MKKRVFKRVTALFMSMFMLMNMVVVVSAEESTTTAVAEQTPGVDAQLYWANEYTESTGWNDIESSETSAVYSGEVFEPGKEIVKYFKIANAGTRAFSYELDLLCENAEGLANAIEVYYQNDVSAPVKASEMTFVGTLAEVFGDKAVSDGKILPNGLADEGFYTYETVTAIALKMHDDANASYMGEAIADFSVQLKAYTLEKFDIMFENTDKYLYRVGNQNAVALSSLFKAISSDVDIDSSKVDVEIVPVDSATNASGTYTANTSEWTQGTIQFSGTGPVAVTISESDFIPVTLNLEVVDAKNVTTATSATANNVVLLNNTSGTFDVKNGYAFYGNGFKVTCSGDGSYRSASVSYGFVTVENGGILDNVQIVCDIFPESYVFAIEMQAGSDGRYPYGYSAVVINGNSTISNCYIYGARNNIQVGNGNVTIKDTVTECGSLSNIHIKSTSDYTVTLDNVTTIQYQITSKYDTSKKVLGFGVLVGDNESETNAVINLKGDLRQYNWVTSADTGVSNSYAKSAITSALKETAYQHTIDDTISVNMGIVYLNGKTVKIEDNRINKTDIPYKLSNVTINGFTGQVYSLSGSNVTAGSRYNAETDNVIPYTPEKNGYIPPVITLTGEQSDAVSLENVYDSSKGCWISKIVVDLDNVSSGSYGFKFSSLQPQKCGVNLDFTVKDSAGEIVSKTTPVTLNQLFSGEYTLIISDDLVFDVTGEKTGATEIYNCPFVLNATKTSIEPPKFTNAGTATAIRLVSSKGGEWRPAYTALTGITVTYWSASEKKVKTVDLSTLYNSGTISSNVWTYTCDDYTLTITGGAVHSDGTTITPVVANKTLYFASTNKAFGTKTTSRNIILTYVFTDKNASTTWNRTETVTYSELGEYDYNSFKNSGTLKAPDSGCITSDTLVTLSDGTKKRVDELTYNDKLLAWDFFKGEYVSAPISIIINHGKTDYEVVDMIFEDGTELEISVYHSLYDADLKKYVIINADTVSDYVGHNFIKSSVDETGTVSNEKVKLIKYEVKTEETTSYSLATSQYYNCIANGILTVTPDPVEGWYDYFEIDDDMKYNVESVEETIAKYGLYTYDDFSDYLTYEEFVAFNCPYLKIPVGKGLFTFNDILGQIEFWGLGYSDNENEDVVKPVASEDTASSPETIGNTDVSGEAEIASYSVVVASEEITEATTDTVISFNNSINAATYGIEVSFEDETLTDNSYVCKSTDFECEFTIKATGTASTGYVKIVVDGDTYYTPQITNDSTYTVTVKNAKGKNTTFTPMWGTYLGETIADNVIKIGFFIESLNTTTEKADVVFVNATDTPVTGNAFVSVFNGDRFIDCTVQNITVNANSEYTYSSVIGIPNGYKVRAFMLGDGAKPLANVIEN